MIVVHQNFAVSGAGDKFANTLTVCISGTSYSVPCTNMCFSVHDFDWKLTFVTFNITSVLFCPLCLFVVCFLQVYLFVLTRSAESSRCSCFSVYSMDVRVTVQGEHQWTLWSMHCGHRFIHCIYVYLVFFWWQTGKCLGDVAVRLQVWLVGDEWWVCQVVVVEWLLLTHWCCLQPTPLQLNHVTMNYRPISTLINPMFPCCIGHKYDAHLC